MMRASGPRKNRSERPQGPPDPLVRAVGGTDLSPSGDDASPVAYLEPTDEGNYPLVGFDMFTEHPRREAMEQARDSGQPAASGRVTLIGEAGSRGGAAGAPIGFLIY